MSTGGRSRAAAIALLVGVVVVAGAAVVVPAGLYWTKTGTEIRDARMKTLRAERRAESRNDLSAKRDEWNTFVQSPNSGFVSESSDEAGIKATEDRISALFAQLGGTLTTIEAKAVDGPRQGVRRIALDLRGTLSRKQIGPMLTALESTSPYVQIEKFSARTQDADRLRLDIGGSVFRLSGEDQ